MQSSHFLSDNLQLVNALFERGQGQLQHNRLFSLRQGESLSLRGSPQQNFLYLLKGRLNVTINGRHHVLLEQDDSSKRILPLSADGELCSVCAELDSVFNHVDSRRLDDLITWSGIARLLENDPEKLAVLSRVMTTRSLTNLPVESVFSLISRMRMRQVFAGEIIVQQGAQADHFYILHKGKAEVWSLGLYDDEPQHVSTLGEGDSFGEDALITGGTRNATVKMQTDGIILEGDKADFLQLIAGPVIEEVDIDMANLLRTRPDYQLLDVRYEEEHEDVHIEGSHLLPLHELRSRLHELDSGKRYITYCRSGKRSAVAALVLKQKKFHAVSMRGGINEWLESHGH